MTQQAGLIEVKVPDIGDFSEVEVIEVLVKPGDRIEPEQSLVTVESDKASMEIPSSAGGIVREVLVKIGDKVAEGSPVLRLEAEGGASTGGSVAAEPDVGTTRTAAPDAAPLGAPASGVAATATVPRHGGAPAPAGGLVEVPVPDIGDFDQVEVIELLVKAGDTVAAEQSLVTVESDKASMEIPSPAAGTIAELKVKIGDKVSKGSLLAMLRTGEAGAQAAPAPVPASAAPAPAPVAAPAPAQVAPPAPAAPAAAMHAPGTDHGPRPHASPSVRKFARELGVDLRHVRGTGPKERITQDDVRAYVKDAVGRAAQPAPAAAAPAAADGAGLGLLPWPKVDFAKFGEIETQPLPRIKKLSGANLHRNWVMIPHVTNHDDADITELEAFRVQMNREHEKAGVKFTMLAFLIKACVSALRKFPEFNASLDGDRLVLKKYFHIGFAADTPNGLMVPVIRDADRKGVIEIAREMSELAKKARDGKLSPAEMQGGCFSISSLGGIGGTYFTPIINAPEVAILGVCRSANRPVWNEAKGAFEPRLILPLSLSWDHRVIDGAAAARFNAHLVQVLGDFRRILL